jgi:hypothetical protein
MATKGACQSNPCHGGQGEGGHHHPHRAAAAFEGHGVGHHGLHQRAKHAPESARSDACGHQQGIAGRQAAGQGGQGKAGIEPQQQALAFEAVDVGDGNQARGAGGQRVGRDQQAELGVADGKQPRELRAQRHHHHEVDDVGELDAGQGQQQPAFALRRLRRGMHGARL